MNKKPIIITVANQKGGVGKTTTVANLASSLADKGKMILVIDCDYQANATCLLCGDEQLSDNKRSLTQAIKDDLSFKEVVVGTRIKNIDMIAANRDLDELREQLAGQPNQFKLIEFLLRDPSISKYDFVIIDTHPSLDCFFQSAIAYSDHYLIPMFPEADSSRGLAHQLQVVEKTKKYLNPKLNFLGCLMAKFDRYNATHRKFEQIIRQMAKENNLHVFKTNIPNSSSVAAASAHGLPLCHYKKSSIVTKAYESLAKEIIKIVSNDKMKKKPAKRAIIEVAADL